MKMRPYAIPIVMKGLLKVIRTEEDGREISNPASERITVSNPDIIKEIRIVDHSGKVILEFRDINSILKEINTSNYLQTIILFRSKTKRAKQQIKI